MSDIPPPFDAIWFQALLGLIVGLAIGSFATMLAYRLPRHLSIITPRSHCTKCNATLQPRDLVPVLSYVLAKGKCRYCGVKIGAQYVWIEVACGLLGAATVVLIGRL